MDDNQFRSRVAALEASHPEPRRRTVEDWLDLAEAYPDDPHYRYMAEIAHNLDSNEATLDRIEAMQGVEVQRPLLTLLDGGAA